jgi:hypothetical protein
MRRETPTSADLRRWALQCGARASSVVSADERQRLLTMREALLDLADNEDWLSGIARGRDLSARIAKRKAEPCALSRTG